MSIEDYFQQIRDLIEASQIVFSFNINAEKKGLYKGFIRGDIYFNDGSLLHLREFVNYEFCEWGTGRMPVGASHT